MGFWGVPISLDIRATDPIDTDRSTIDTIQQMIVLARVSVSSPAVNHVVEVLKQSLPKYYSQ